MISILFVADVVTVHSVYMYINLSYMYASLG